MTEEQLEDRREYYRLYRRRIKARKLQMMAEQEAAREAARAKRMTARPDAFGRTEDEIVRTFTREELYGEQQTARYRGTGFYAGRRA